MVRNYQKELEQQINKQQKLGEMPKLLLHSCCAPCSSYVLEYLSPYFHIYDFYYNPNISPKREYEERKEELENKKRMEELTILNNFLNAHDILPQDIIAMYTQQFNQKVAQA